MGRSIVAVVMGIVVIAITGLGTDSNPTRRVTEAGGVRCSIKFHS